MNAQQAPTSGCSGVARQASRSVPDQTASMKKNPSTGGTAQAINSAQTSVNAMLAGEENRLARSQLKAPVAARGGGSLSAGTRRTYAKGSSPIATIAVSAPPPRRYARKGS